MPAQIHWSLTSPFLALRCQCLTQFHGPLCQLTLRTFHGDGYACFPPIKFCSDFHLSLEFISDQSDGTILYHGLVSGQDAEDSISVGKWIRNRMKFYEKPWRIPTLHKCKRKVLSHVCIPNRPKLFFKMSLLILQHKVIHGLIFADKDFSLWHFLANVIFIMQFIE